MNKTHYKDFFQSNTLQDNAFDVASDTVATIASIQEQELQTKEGKQIHLCAFLQGYDKPLRINKTIAKNIAKALKTPDITQWSGKQIAIYIEQGLKAFSDVYDVPRVRPTAPRVQVNTAQFEEALNKCTTADQVRSTWSGFPENIKNNPFITGLCKRLVEKLEEGAE